MKKLELSVVKEKIHIDKKIRDSFTRPLVFYTANLNTVYLNTFVVIDFQKEELIYYKTSTPNNIKFIQKNPRYLSGTPHSILKVGNGFFSFLLTLDPTNKKEFTFRFVDLKNNTFNILSSMDLNHPDFDKLSLVSETSEFCDDSNYFYIAFMNRQQSNTTYFKCSQDLNEVEKIGSDDSILQRIPHQLKKFKNYLISTGFSERGFIFPNGDICEDIEEYLRDKFKNLKRISSMLQNNYNNVFLTVTNFPQFKYQITDGKMLIWDLESKSNPFFCELKSKPSHVEIYNDDLFVLSNNISAIRKNFLNTNSEKEIYYLAPGIIEKIKFENGKFKSVGCFSDEKGYRFTSHKIFVRNNIPYIVTFGHPNRLFVINGISMKLEYYYDIDFDILSKHSDVRMFLNDIYIDKFSNSNRYSALEISQDNKYIIFMSQTHIRFFDIDLKEIVYEIPFKMEKGFVQITTHCDYL